MKKLPKKLFKKASPQPKEFESLEQLPDPPAKASQGHWKEVFSTVALLTVAVVIALVTKAFILQPYVVEGQSMETTLQNGDRLLVDKLPLTIAKVNKHTYVPHRGDIIIFNQGGLPGYSGPKQLIKRVIGLPGDKVIVNNGKITIYDRAHPKGFNPDAESRYRIDAPTTPGAISVVLARDQLFVCGDNRTNSEDSRYFGPINTDQVVGKLWLRIFPLGNTQHF